MAKKYAQGIIEGSKNIADGSYFMNNQNIRDIVPVDFDSEIDLRKYLLDNPEYFAKYILNDRFISAKKEWIINTSGKIRGKRADLLFVCKEGNYLIELKCPRYPHDLSRAIGQVMTYIYHCYCNNINIKEFIILTTKCDVEIPQIIQYFKIPIRIVVFSRTMFLSANN